MSSDPQGSPLPSVISYALPGTYAFVVPDNVYMLFVEVIGGGASGASGQANGNTGASGNPGLPSNFELHLFGGDAGFFGVLAAQGGIGGMKSGTYGDGGLGGFSQPQDANAPYGQLGLAGPAGDSGTAASGTTGGNGGAGAPSPLGLLGGGVPGIGVAGSVPASPGQQPSYPGAGGGGGAGAGGASPGGGGGGGGGGGYTAGYVPVVPGQTYRVKVGTGGAAPSYPDGYPTCQSGAGAPGAIIIHMYATRAVDDGCLIFDAQRHFGTAGTQGSTNVTIAAGSNKLSNHTLLMDGQGISVNGAGAGGGTLYARVLAGGTTNSLVLSVPAQTSVTNAVAANDDTAALNAFAAALGSTGVGRVPPGTYNVSAFPAFTAGATVYCDDAFVSVNGAAAVAFNTLLPGYGFSVTTPSLPAGTGSTDAVTNANTFPVRITQDGASGTHIIDAQGTDKALPADPVEFTLDPGAKVYYATTVPSAWLWYGVVS